MTLDQLLSEAMYFKDGIDGDSQRSAVTDIAEFLLQYPRNVYLPTQEQVDLLTGYLIVIGKNFQPHLGNEDHVYYVLGP